MFKIDETVCDKDERHGKPKEIWSQSAKEDMIGKKDKVRKNLIVKDFVMLMSLGFILREKEIAVLKNFTKKEYDITKYALQKFA